MMFGVCNVNVKEAGNVWQPIIMHAIGITIIFHHAILNQIENFMIISHE